MNIGFVTDTNMIRLSDNDAEKDVDFLKNTRFYLEYLNSLEKLNIETKLFYIMPSIIIEELYNKKLETYNKRYNSFKEKYEEISYGLTGSLPQNNYVRELERQKRIQRNFLIVEPKLTVNEFEKVMRDALKKEPPFNKEIDGKKSDAGFKDYMIWRSLVTNRFSKIDKIYFFTGDKVFEENKTELEKQFNRRHKKTKIEIIYINPECSDKQKESLEIIINKYNLPKTDVVKLYDYDIHLMNIRNIDIQLNAEIAFLVSYNRMAKIKDINYYNFGRDDIIINEVNKKDGDYSVVVDFSTLKYNTDICIEENEKVIVKGTLILHYKKNGLNYVLKSVDLENLSFESTTKSLENIIKYCDFDCPKGVEKLLLDHRKKIIENDLMDYNRTISNFDKFLNLIVNNYDEKMLIKSISKNVVKKGKSKKDSKE